MIMPRIVAFSGRNRDSLGFLDRLKAGKSELCTVIPENSGKNSLTL